MGFSERWKQAGMPADEFDPPNGTYPVKVVETGAFAGNDGREWAKATLEVVAGEHQGRRFDDFMNLNNDVGLRIARENLSMYGLKDADAIEDLDDLASGMLELTGVYATVSVTHSSAGFVNVKVTQTRTGESDIPGQETFDVNGGDAHRKPASAIAGPADDDDDDGDIPF